MLTMSATKTSALVFLVESGLLEIGPHGEKSAHSCCKTSQCV